MNQRPRGRCLLKKTELKNLVRLSLYGWTAGILNLKGTCVFKRKKWFQWLKTKNVAYPYPWWSHCKELIAESPFTSSRPTMVYGFPKTFLKCVAAVQASCNLTDSRNWQTVSVCLDCSGSPILDIDTTSVACLFLLLIQLCQANSIPSIRWLASSYQSFVAGAPWILISHMFCRKPLRRVSCNLI